MAPALHFATHDFRASAICCGERVVGSSVKSGKQEKKTKGRVSEQQQSINSFRTSFQRKQTARQTPQNNFKLLYTYVHRHPKDLDWPHLPHLDLPPFLPTLAHTVYVPPTATVDRNNPPRIFFWREDLTSYCIIIIRWLILWLWNWATTYYTTE